MSFKGEESSPWGSVPDPANRHWRHPSELRAMAAAPIPSPTIRESGLGSLVLFGALTVGAMSGLLIVLSVGGTPLFGDGGLSVADGELAETAIGNQLDPEADPVLPSPIVPTTESRPTTTLLSAAARSTLALSPTSAVDAPTDLWSETSSTILLDGVELADHGVFSSPDGVSRVASFIVIDDLVVTSAGAVEGKDVLWLRQGGRWTSATVTMTDPYTDVAVLDPVARPEATLSLAAESSDALDPGDLISVVAEPIGLDERDEPGPSGYISRSGEIVKTTLNRFCYDAFTTSVNATAAPPGSAVVQGDGSLVGMTISTSAPTVAAVPIATVTAVARAMTDLGSPSAGWLGVEVGLGPDGDTEVLGLAPTGPAFDVLAVDDEILTVDGQEVENPDHLVHLVRSAAVGADTEVVVERDGVVESITVRTAPVPDKR